MLSSSSLLLFYLCDVSCTPRVSMPTPVLSTCTPIFLTYTPVLSMSTVVYVVMEAMQFSIASSIAVSLASPIPSILSIVL